MKSINSSFILFGVLLLGLSSCEPKNEYTEKSVIGELYENQGMVTYEGKLYSDSTFYIPSARMVNFSTGKFKITGDTIEFITEGGTKILSDVYNMDSTHTRIHPLNSELDEWIYLQWIDD